MFYKNLSKRVNAMTGEGVSKPEAVGRIISQALSSAVAQTSAQSIEESVSEVSKQGRAYLDSMEERQQRPEPVPASRTNIQIPNVSPVQAPAVSDVSNIRQRARENPAVAATLLGGLGSAGLL